MIERETEINGDFILASIRGEHREALSPMSQSKYFQSVLNLMDKFHFDTPPNCAIYFAPRVKDKLEKEIHAKNPHLLRPWDTDAGHFLLNVGLKDPSQSLLDWNQLSFLRRKLVQNFALKAQGNFTIVFSEIRNEPEEGIISSVLLPALLRNTNVTHINQVEKRKAVEIYFDNLDKKRPPKGRVFSFSRH